MESDFSQCMNNLSGCNCSRCISQRFPQCNSYRRCDLNCHIFACCDLFIHIVCIISDRNCTYRTDLYTLSAIHTACIFQLFAVWRYKTVSNPRFSFAITITPCFSVHVSTQRLQRIHLLISRMRGWGTVIKSGITRFQLIAVWLIHIQISCDLLKLTASVFGTYKAILWMSCQYQFHNVFSRFNYFG